MCNRHSQRDSGTLIHTTKGPAKMHMNIVSVHTQTQTKPAHWKRYCGGDTSNHRPIFLIPATHTEHAAIPGTRPSHRLTHPPPCTGTTSRTHTSELRSPVHTKAPSAGCSVAGGRAQPEHTGFHSEHCTNQTKANRAQASHPSMGRFLDDY